MLRLSYWVFPIIGGLVWLGTLLGLFLHCTQYMKFNTLCMFVYSC